MEELIPISPGSYLEWFDLEKTPLLKIAAENARPAYSVSLEWLVNYFDGGELKHRVLRNFTQIMRQPFSVREGQTFGEAMKEAGEKILHDAELTLWYGKPSRDYSDTWPVTTCGGVMHHLKRRPYENDFIALRELRPLILRRDVMDGVHEWLWEFSLQVNPGHYERSMKPIALPPKKPNPKTVTAFPEGSTLDQGVPVAV